MLDERDVENEINQLISWLAELNFYYLQLNYLSLPNARGKLIRILHVYTFSTA